jgi:hypothetical protein
MAGWQAVASSADGSTLAGAVSGSDGGGIYISKAVVPPRLMATPSGGNVILSWPPASGFNLQQNLSLATTNWADVAASLVLTNLRFEVTLPPTNNAAFFRLKHP